jgi:hypothetical protein
LVVTQNVYDNFEASLVDMTDYKQVAQTEYAHGTASEAIEDLMWNAKNEIEDRMLYR